MANISKDKEIPITSVVTNQHVKDSGSKFIFKDPILCAEFLRGYVNVDLLKNVKPEDIEDISERFIPMWQEERDADSVKKIRINDTSLYVITIVEHQSKIHYDMSFLLFTMRVPKTGLLCKTSKSGYI